MVAGGDCGGPLRCQTAPHGAQPGSYLLPTPLSYSLPLFSYLSLPSHIFFLFPPMFLRSVPSSLPHFVLFAPILPNFSVLFHLFLQYFSFSSFIPLVFCSILSSCLSCALPSLPPSLNILLCSALFLYLSSVLFFVLSSFLPPPLLFHILSLPRSVLCTLYPLPPGLPSHFPIS